MECLSPMSVRRPNGVGATDRVIVPCGKCMACLSKKRSHWAFRLKQELKVSKTALFVTLTYSEENLPIKYVNDTGETWDRLGLFNGAKLPPTVEISLSKRDCQLFLKRLRSLDYHYRELHQKCPIVSENFQEWPKLRYFLVGEYGDMFERPHYHMILFNLPTWPDAKFMLESAWTNPDTKISIGMVHIGTVTPASISYTAKYCISTMVEEKFREKNFSLQSKGLGISYVVRMKKFHTDKQMFFAMDQGGKKVSLPRYYRDKIFIDYEKRKAQILATIERDRLPYLGGESELQTKRQYTTKVIKNSKKK